MLILETPFWLAGAAESMKIRIIVILTKQVQAGQGCPRLRWAMVDHGSQLASSRRSLCQVQKSSYSSVSVSALEKTASPYCLHARESFLLSRAAETTQEIACGRASALAGSSRPGVPEAAPGHGRSW